ncbi:DUF6527 family protein [Humibacter sp.]|uniref:DUF6527 family protein n=1 Tax=Humibacter sp. TaxID=1940291 RepID=UPI003F7E78CB
MITRLQPKFTETIPPLAEMEPGVLYVSTEYATVSHLCACGCGEEVTISLRPKRWKLTFDGDTVTLNPSIGNTGLACRSHYFIRENGIIWLEPLSDDASVRARHRDDLELNRPSIPDDAHHTRSWLDRVTGMFRREGRRHR